MSDTDKEDVPMAECGSCRAIIPLDSKQCPECGIGFSGVSDEALGECGACNSLVPINSKSCPECGVYFVADNVLNVLKEWFINTGIDSRKLFAKFDSDSDGHIDADELKDGLLKMNLADLPPSQIDRLIAEVDTDNDGVISLDELVSAITDEPAEDNESDSDSSASAKQYSENVVERVMNKHEITDKEHFLAFAASFDENENDYLTEAELKKAAAAYLEQVDAGEEAQELDEIVTDVSAGEHITEEDSDVVDETTDESEMVEEAEIDGMVADPVDDDEQTDDDTAVIAEEETTSDQYLAKLVAAANDQDLTIRDMFESIDVDKNGLIDGPELQKGINSIAGDYLSPGDIMGIISLVDKDSDGRINAFELIEVIESMDTGIESDRLNEPMDVLLDYIDSMDVDVAAMFRNLDKNRDGKINREELANALNEHSNEEVDEEAITNLVNMFDVDGNDSIDLFEFIETLEAHDDQLPDENTSLSSPKEFPSNMQKRMMSKRWKDVVWPLIHAGFAFFVLIWVVNGTLAPFVDGNGGTVVLDTQFGQTIGSDGTLYVNGDAYPCDDTVQIDGCKNSLTPFAGEGGEISMPAGFYWDGILFIVVGTIGLIGSLVTQYSLVPGWRARLKAMRDNESEKEAVKEAVSAEDDGAIEESPDDDMNSEDENIDESSEDVSDAVEDSDEEDEIDIGSYIGLLLEDEEIFGTIIEFDDEEGLVTIEEDGTGDLVTGYQDDMFLED